MATIGGPGTRLPFVVESFLGWSLCISCLTVSGYHYVKSVAISSALYRRVRRLVRSILGGWLITKCNRDNSHEDLAWIPLTTHSRSELSRQTPWERYLSLVQVLERRYPDALLPILPPERSLIEAVTDEEGREVDGPYPTNTELKVEDLVEYEAESPDTELMQHLLKKVSDEIETQVVNNVILCETPRLDEESCFERKTENDLHYFRLGNQLRKLLKLS